MFKFSFLLNILVLLSLSTYSQLNRRIPVFTDGYLDFSKETPEYKKYKNNNNSSFAKPYLLTNCPPNDISLSYHRPMIDDSLYSWSSENRNYFLYNFGIDSCGGDIGQMENVFPDSSGDIRNNHALFVKRNNNSGVRTNTYRYCHTTIKDTHRVVNQINCNPLTINVFNSSNFRQSLRFIIVDNQFWHLLNDDSSTISIGFNQNGILQSMKNNRSHTNKSSLFSNAEMGLSNDQHTIGLLESNNGSVIVIYDFNHIDGSISNRRVVLREQDLPNFLNCTNYNTFVSSPIFSENDSLMYVVYSYAPNCNRPREFRRVQIYQMERYHTSPYMTKKLIYNNIYVFDVFSNPPTQYTIFSAPDGNIYFGMPGSSILNRIENNSSKSNYIVRREYINIPNEKLVNTFTPVNHLSKRASFQAFSSCEDDTVRAVFYGSNDVNYISYIWGDGSDTTEIINNPLKNGDVTTHVYDSSGIYVIHQRSIFDCDFNRHKRDTLQVNLPPKIKNTTWAVDTNCGFFEVTLDFEAAKTQEVYLHWGDGNSDTVLLGNALGAYQFTHRYETEDTLDIQVEWKGFHAGGSHPACTQVFDTTVVSVFRPQPEGEFDFTKNGSPFTQYDNRYYACIGDSITFKPKDIAVQFMVVPFVNDTIPNLLYAQTLTNTGLNIIHLEFHNEFSCSETILIPLTVLPPPSFEWQNALSWCESSDEQPLAFSAQTVADDAIIQTKMAINTWSESQQSAAFASQKIFNEANAYNVTISAETLHGCKADSLVELVVHSLPKTTLSGTEEVCENQEVEIQAHIAQAEEATTVFEAFGERNTHIQSMTNPPIWTHYPPVGQHVLQAYTESNQGCRDTALFHFEVIAKPQISFEHNEYDFCEEAQPVTIGGTYQSSRNVTITWTVAAGNLIENTTQNTFSGQWSGLQDGSYPVSILANMESLNCADSAATEVHIFAHPEVHFITEPICENETEIGEISWQDATGLERLEYGSGGNIWENIEASSETSGEISVEGSLSAGNHSITIRALNPKGCATEITEQIRVLELPKAQMNLQFYQSEGVEVTYQLRDESVRHSGVIWDMGDGTTYEESPQQRRFHTFADTGRYWVTLTAHREYRCFDSLGQWLDVRPFIKFLLPNAISTNNDGLNDYLNFDLNFVSSMNLEIFNRWGQKLIVITEKDHLKETAKLPQGTYLLTGYIRDFREKQHFIHQTLVVVQ